MMIPLNRFWLLLPLVLTIFLKFTNAQVTFTFEKTSCHYAGESLVLVANYTGGLPVTQVDWYFEHKTSANLPISDLVTCIRFGAPIGGYPNDRMNFTCDTSTNIYKANIFNLDGTENGDWGVIFTLNDGSTTTLSKSTFTLCTGCNVPSVDNADIDTSGTVQENVVATVTCNDGFVIEGSSSTTTSTHTCQSDGTWVPVFPSILCEQPPCNLIVCWIIVIVYLVTCIILLVIYCVMQCEFDSDNSSLILKYILPACILTVIGIVVTVVVSRVAEKDCSIGACLVGPLIVSIIESWIPMIVICIHRKCCGNWKDDKDKTKNKKLADQADEIRVNQANGVHGSEVNIPDKSNTKM